MDELLKQLLEAEILSEDTKTELESAFNSQLAEAIDVAKTEAEADVRAQLTEQWVEERDSLVEAVDAKVNDFLEKEMTELKEDIESFRDLEAEFAEKLVEEKTKMADQLKVDLVDLVETVNTFLEMRLVAEMTELKEDLDEVRKNDFGRKIFTAFAQEYITTYADEDSASATLKETQQRLHDVETALAESEEDRDMLKRNDKMKEILSPLEGRQKEVMEAILKNVDTDKLEEGYKTFIGRVIRESDEHTTEKEEKVLAEDVSDTGEVTKEDAPLKEGVTVTGDVDDITPIEESAPAADRHLDQLRKLAGIK